MKRTLTTLLVALLVGGFTLTAAVGPAAAAGDVTITVEDSTGTAVEGANVTLYNATDDTQVTTGTTDSNGTVTFSSQTDGDYYAEVEADGYLSATSSTLTVAGSAVTETVTVEEEPDEVLNETVDIAEDTDTLWADVEAANATDVTFTYYGINESSGNETQLSTETLSPSAGEWVGSSYDLTDNDTSDYDSARIVVETNNANDINQTDFGTTVVVSGGGGGGVLDGAGALGGAGGLVVLVGVGYLLMGRD